MRRIVDALMPRSKGGVRTPQRPSYFTRITLGVEALESRTVPYAAIAAWPHPELVTISFMPDGTYLGGSLYSNLFASFDAKWPTAAWQGQVLLAVQTWAQYTNLNFAVVPDEGLPLGTGIDQQGDPEEGDIRIGGFSFASGDLAGAWFPPPVNNFSAAGDVFFNTAQPFNIGSTYDLFTVATHELGHALGLLHSDDYYAAMFGNYVGVKSYGLAWDDVAGIRSLYSAGAPRSPDGFGFNTSTFQTAADLTGAFDPVTQTLVGASLDLTYPGQAEYFRFMAPPGAGSQLTVTVQSSGLSLLSPSLTLYDADQQPIATASGYSQFGTAITATAASVKPNQLFFLRVSGADASAFGTGHYGLIVNFGSGLSPTVSPPNTATPNGVPNVGIGGWPEEIGTGSDGQGFDSFEVKPGEVAQPAQRGSTPQSLRGAPGATPHGPGNEAAVLLHGSVPVGPAALLVYSVPVGPRTLATVPLPLLDLRLPLPASVRTETGEDGSTDLLGEVVADPVPSLPDRDSRTLRTQATQLSSPASRWRAACTDYFAEVEPAIQQPCGNAGTSRSASVDALPGLDSAAALLVLTVTLGGCWRDQRELVRGVGFQPA
jgi:hypothetical protein